MDENSIYRWDDESGMKRSHYIEVKWWTDGEMMRIKREVEKYAKMWKPILISGALNTQHAIWTMITWTKCKRSWLCRAHVRTIIWDVSSVLENQQRRRQEKSIKCKLTLNRNRNSNSVEQITILVESVWCLFDHHFISISSILFSLSVSMLLPWILLFLPC